MGQDKLVAESKPFLRWAGGKRWLIKDISRFLPSDNFGAYHEPFLGGGAVFFYLKPVGEVFLSDLNSDLIETYVAVQNNVEEVIRELLKFENSKESYYQVRSSHCISEPYKMAARFIFLNQTSFNGIYRVNLKGEYNVPYGYRHNYTFDIENLRRVSLAIKNVKFKAQDFYDITTKVKKGDLVFLDPPYTVAHNHNGFIEYNKKIFSLQDQIRLSDTIQAIKKKGAYYILTNAAHQKIREIFSNGDTFVELTRASLIGGKNATRGKYEELILTNTCT